VFQAKTLALQLGRFSGQHFFIPPGIQRQLIIGDDVCLPWAKISTSSCERIYITASGCETGFLAGVSARGAGGRNGNYWKCAPNQEVLVTIVN
jgi:hypothetical protein